MRVTERTKYSEIEPYEELLTEATKQALTSAAEAVYIPMNDLPFVRFFECANGDFEGVLGKVEDPTVLQVYWAKRFEEFMKEFAKAMKDLTLPQTTDEIQAARGLVETGWAENVLVFVQKYFGLKSFREAEQMTIGEIVIARRAQYNQDKYQRQMAALQAKKLQKK